MIVCQVSYSGLKCINISIIPSRVVVNDVAIFELALVAVLNLLTNFIEHRLTIGKSSAFQLVAESFAHKDRLLVDVVVVIGFQRDTVLFPASALLFLVVVVIDRL